MSIIRMREKFEHVFKPVLILIAAIFFVSIFFMYNSLNFDKGRGKDGTTQIATVNGTQVSAQEFDRRFNQAITEAENQRGSLSPLDTAGVRSQVLSQMIQERIQVAAAEKEGIDVGRREISAARDKMVNDAIDQQKQVAFGQANRDPKAKKKKISDAEFREWLKSRGTDIDTVRTQIASGYPDAFMRDQLMIQKLQAKVRSGFSNISDKQLQDAFREVKMAQIVIGGLPDAQAKQKADSVLKELQAGGDFAELAKKFSTDPMTKNKGGVSDSFMPIYGDKDLQTLKVGDTSGVLKSYQGYRIVKILDSRMPKDFEKNKKSMKDQYVMMQSYKTLGEILQKAEESAVIKWENPSYEGFYLADKAMYMPPTDQAKQQKMMKDAIAKLEKARTTDSHPADVSCKLAQIYMGQKQYQKAIDILVDIMDKRRLVDHVQLRLLLSYLYIQNNQSDKAVAQLKDVSESNANPQVHVAVQSLYKAMKRPDLEAVEAKWIKDHQAMMAPTPTAPAAPAKAEAQPKTKAEAKPVTKASPKTTE